MRGISEPDLGKERTGGGTSALRHIRDPRCWCSRSSRCWGALPLSCYFSNVLRGVCSKCPSTGQSPHFNCGEPAAGRRVGGAVQLGPISFKNIYLFVYQREGKGKRKRGRETSMGCLLHVPRRGTKPATQVCALTRNRTSYLLLCGTMPN